MSRTHPAHDSLPPDQQCEADDTVIARALRRSLVVLLAFGLAAGGFWLWRPRPKPPQTRPAAAVIPQVAAPPTQTLPSIPFTDITAAAGIDFVHENGAYGDKLLPETMGGGCAFFDYDNDGHPDLLLVNSCRWPWDPRPAAPPATAALYRNDGRGRFRNVTREAGLDVSLYGMGVAVGDYDNDGWVDVYLSAVGTNRLFRNDRSRFRDVTRTAGVAGPDDAWSTACGWLDYDNDGDLDLMVCNYVVWSKQIDLAQNFQLLGHGRAYGPPVAFAGTFPELYRNDGQGRFTPVAEEAGLHVRNPVTGVPLAKALGLLPIDVNQDGWTDLVVANDTVQNLLFLNQQDGTFREIGMASGLALDPAGLARGAMGIDGADLRDNGRLAVAIGNFANETTALYVAGRDPLRFTDEAVIAGLGAPTRQALTFGVLWLDADLDGRLDLLAANGHLENEIHLVQPSQTYAQPPQLFFNRGSGSRPQFVLLPPENCGADFCRPIVGRGAACADIDGDGDLDLLLTAVGGPPRLLRNDQHRGHAWIRLKLVGSTANRDAIGAQVEVTSGGRCLRRQVMPTRSYLSQVELPVTIGLGKAAAPPQVRIIWPGGQTQTLRDVPLNRLTTIVQPAPAGTGQP